MLGAILRQADKTWFFKLTAPPDEAADLREEFGQFVASTRFEDGQPSWEIPANWTEERGRPMRFTTYRIGENGPEVSISTLPNNSGETAAAVANINRWRGQLGLPDLTSSQYQRALESDTDAKQILPEDEGEIVSMTVPAGKVILVDFVGEMAQGGGPPFANMGSRPAGPATPPVGPPAPEQAAARTPRLNPPRAWRPAEPDAFSLAAYQAGEGDDASRVTLSSVGGDLILNVNRWRNQVGLPPWSPAELAEKKQMLSGEAYTAEYFELVGPAETILAAVINYQGSPWIVKLRGPNQSASAQIDNFKQFVQSIEF